MLRISALASHALLCPIATGLITMGLATTGVLSAADAPKNLLPNGDMESGKKDTPSHWAGTWGIDEANRFLRLTGGTPTVSAARVFPLSGQRALQLAWRYRHSDLTRDEKTGQDARLGIDFLDSAGQVVLPGPAYPTFSGSSTGWQKRTVRFFVPPNATALRLSPALIGQTGGTLDLDQFSLSVISPSDVPEESNTTGNIAVDAGKGRPSALHVDGRRLVDGTGKELWLQGISVPGLEGKTEGKTGSEALIQSIATAIEVWKANVIRLPVNSTAWLATGEGAKAYREQVDQAVLAASSRGAYVILDLHRFRAPTDADAAFWKDAATRFKDHPAVLFGLFNAPHGLSWAAWKSGGMVEDLTKTGSATAGESTESLGAFTTCGMQALIDAVRSTGAKNAVLIGGLDWAYDLSGVLHGFDLDDKGGNGIIWDTHVVPGKSGWQSRFLEVAKTRAVLVGEVGCDQARSDSVPPERSESPYAWAPDMLGCIQQNRLHWTASAFAPAAAQPLVQNQTNFAPTPFWGAYVRSALLGKQFTPTKLR